MADKEDLARELRLAHHAIKEALGYVNEASDTYSTEHAEAEVRAVKDSLTYAEGKLDLAESRLAALLERLE